MRKIQFKQNRAWISGLLLSGILFMILAVIDTSTNLLPFDLQVTRALQSFNYPLITKAMILISWFGYSPQSYIIVVLSTIILFCAHLRWEAVVSAASSLCTQEIDQLVKLVVRHPRPAADQVHVLLSLKDYSFPSGHVMFYTVYFGFSWYLIFTLTQRSWARTLSLVLLSVPIILVGASRVFLGAHWASDVIGGYILSGIMLTAFIQFYRFGKEHFFKPHS